MEVVVKAEKVSVQQGTSVENEWQDAPVVKISGAEDGASATVVIQGLQWDCCTTCACIPSSPLPMISVCLNASCRQPRG